MSVFDQIIERGHERVAFHHDPVTGLRAIVAIHNTKLGNALGGTRRWFYEAEEDALYDVLRLSQGMTYKSAAAGLPMGGSQERGHAAQARPQGHRSRSPSDGTFRRHLQRRLYRC